MSSTRAFLRRTNHKHKITSARNATPPRTPPIIAPTGIELFELESESELDCESGAGVAVGVVVDVVELEEKLATDRAGKISLPVVSRYLTVYIVVP